MHSAAHAYETWRIRLIRKEKAVLLPADAGTVPGFIKLDRSSRCGYALQILCSGPILTSQYIYILRSPVDLEMMLMA